MMREITARMLKEWAFNCDKCWNKWTSPSCMKAAPSPLFLKHFSKIMGVDL